MRPTTRSREYREGWIGRRRTYKCRECGLKFQVDTREPLPEKDRVCQVCRPYDTKRVEAEFGNFITGGIF